MNPTIVLVHGAFAESASWDRVIDPLVSAGHPVVGVANPLRGLTADAVARRSSSASISHPSPR
jgi:pimeloyl-ACP methyl ester carboxylesterase